MARAVLPNPSARAGWLFAGIIDRALHHWGHVLPLDGGPGDHDHADSETGAAIPDDGDDIASLAGYSCVQLSSLFLPGSLPCGRALHHWGHVLPLDGGPGDHDHADSETGAAIPDDGDDIASLAGYSCESVQVSSLHLPGSLPCGRALHHCGHVLPLDGGPGDHDHADSETGAAIPDDGDDIASLAGYSCESVQLSSLYLPGSLPCGGGCFRPAMALPHDHGDQLLRCPVSPDDL